MWVLWSDESQEIRKEAQQKESSVKDSGRCAVVGSFQTGVVGDLVKI